MKSGGLRTSSVNESIVEKVEKPKVKIEKPQAEKSQVEKPIVKVEKPKEQKSESNIELKSKK